MSEAPPPTDELEQAVAAEDWGAVEELWLAVLEDSSVPTSRLSRVAASVAEAGRRAHSLTLLELLAEVLEEREDTAGVLAAVREMACLGRRPDPALVERLELALKASRAGSPSLDKVLKHCDLRASRRPLETLKAAECWLDHDEGTPVEVVGQGVGRVLELNLKLGNVKVAVGSGRPVSVPFGAVARFLRRLPEGSFLHRKVTEPEALASFVSVSPGEALVSLLESLGEPSDVAALRSALQGVLPPERWTSWWAKARKHPRVITSGSGSRLKYQVGGSAESATAALMDDLRRSDPRARLAVARRIADRDPDAAEETARILAEGLSSQEVEDPGLAWEAAEVLSRLPGGEAPARACQERLLAAPEPMRLLLGIADRAGRAQALRRLCDHDADGWPELWSQWLLHEDQSANLALISTQLDREGHGERLDAALETVFRNHIQHPAQFVWACEAMVEQGAPEPLRRRMTASLLERLPDALTRKEFSGLRGRAKAFLDGGKVAIRVMLEAASPAQAERFAQRVIRLPGVEPQRTRLVEQAAVQRLGAGEEDTEPLFVATEEKIRLQRKELQQLLKVEIPKTLKGIKAAADEGDLRENFEYHMLRDRQELLSARAAKLQEDLERVRVLEPGAAETSRVNIGTVVHLEDLDGRPVAPVTILGQWDSDVERRVYANGAELAQGLLGRTVGDEVEIDGAAARITAIRAWPE